MDANEGTAPSEKAEPSTALALGHLGLTPKQEAFALAYCCLMNASDAYREVYQPANASAKTITEEACRLRANPKVAAMISRIMCRAVEVAELTTANTLLAVRRNCFSDIRKLYHDDGSLKEAHELDDDTAAAIERYEVNERVVDGVVVGRAVRVKFWDKNSALEIAARHVGLYDRSKRPPGENLQLQVVLVK